MARHLHRSSALVRHAFALSIPALLSVGIYLLLLTLLFMMLPYGGPASRGVLGTAMLVVAAVIAVYDLVCVIASLRAFSYRERRWVWAMLFSLLGTVFYAGALYVSYTFGVLVL